MSISITSQFFDDVRFEANGKSIYLGVYQENLIVPSLPTTLPQLLIGVNVRYPLDERHVIESIEVQLLEQEPVVFPIAPTEDLSADNRLLEFAPQLYDRRFIQRLPNVVLDKPGRLRVWVSIDGTKHYAGSLLIKVAAPEDAVDMGVIMSIITGFAVIQKLSPEDKSGAAIRMFEALAEMVPAEAIASFSDAESIIFQRPDKSFRVFFVPPRDDTQSLQIETTPANLTPVVKNLDRYGFALSFAEAEAVEGFQINFDGDSSKK
jgi:hypothetical protein